MKAMDADILCLQETKMMQGQAEIDLPGYHEYWNSAVKKGYSGTAVFTREEPLSVSYGIGTPEHDQEGRVITAEYDGFYLVDCYTPNSKRELLRLDYRMVWEDAFRAYLMELDKTKPVILCGDLNVAHEEIDIKNAKSNRRNAGFTDEERAKMTALLQSGFRDSFRERNPELTGAYTWWSYMGNARANNVGWRIDYFIVSDRLLPRVTDAMIYPDCLGSDHCPVGLCIK
jgi:exodeoxyribonuclease-3